MRNNGIRIGNPRAKSHNLGITAPAGSIKPLILWVISITLYRGDDSQNFARSWRWPDYPNQARNDVSKSCLISKLPFWWPSRRPSQPTSRDSNGGTNSTIMAPEKKTGSFFKILILFYFLSNGVVNQQNKRIENFDHDHDFPKKIRILLFLAIFNFFQINFVHILFRIFSCVKWCINNVLWKACVSINMSSEALRVRSSQHVWHDGGENKLTRLS